MAEFYAQVVLYSDTWRLIAQVAGEGTPPFPGAPAEWTADQQLLWALHLEYRAKASAIAMWDGELPDAEILERPEAFRKWFDRWMEEEKVRRSSGTGGEDKSTHGWVLVD